MYIPTFNDVENAQERIKPYIHKTPVLSSIYLNIEWVKYFNRNFTALELQTQKSHRKSRDSSTKNEASPAVPVEVFAAAINAFEADNESS